MSPPCIYIYIYIHVYTRRAHQKGAKKYTGRNRFSGSERQKRTEQKRYEFSCRAGKVPFAVWEAGVSRNNGDPFKPLSTIECCDGSRDFRMTFNWLPMMPRDTPASRTADRCCFPSLSQGRISCKEYFALFLSARPKSAPENSVFRYFF